MRNDTKSDTLHRRRSLVPLFVVVTWGLVLLVFEAGLRICGFQFPSFYLRDPEVGWIGRPGVESLWTKEGRAMVRANSEGFNAPEWMVERSPGDSGQAPTARARGTGSLSSDFSSVVTTPSRITSFLGQIRATAGLWVATMRV